MKEVTAQTLFLLLKRRNERKKGRERRDVEERKNYGWGVLGGGRMREERLEKEEKIENRLKKIILELRFEAQMIIFRLS